MHKPCLFFQLGHIVYRFRLVIIFLWLALVLSCIPFLPAIVSPFKSTGFIDDHSLSLQTDHYLTRHLSSYGDRLMVIYSSKTVKANTDSFNEQIKKSLAPLAHLPVDYQIIYPKANNNQISKDNKSSYAVILFDNKQPLTPDLLKQIKAAIKKPKHMSMQLGGEPLFLESINKQTQKDLFKADLIATPVSIITLILVFGSVIAAFIPIVLGGGCAVIILTTLYFLGHLFTLSIFTLNIALLLGLCLSLDYALFIINRFRDELTEQNDMSNIIAITLATAGKAVFYSGLAVFVSLSALLLFPVNILFSVGVGGLAAVFVAVMIAITLLPAILAIVNHRINAWPIKRFKHDKIVSATYWSSIANTVVRSPICFFLGSLALLILIGLPFLQATFGISDYHILPKHTAERKFFNTYEKKFNINALTPIIAVIKTTHGAILTKNNLFELYDFAHQLKKNPAVSQVSSIVTLDNNLNKQQYFELYHQNTNQLSPEIVTLLKTTTGYNFTTITIVSHNAADSSSTQALLTQLRQAKVGHGLSIQLTGIPVNNAEVLTSIAHTFPFAIAWIMVLTYLILLILLRSIVLPIKAIMMNILSLCASYGMLVFIFQWGHLHRLLNFDPQGMLDISLLVIIFCALFGFSMDYEVFLLTRIKEYYQQGQNNQQSIVFGIEKSSRIITSAAIIVIFICGSFMVADVLMVKEFGLGIAVAIFIDAFLVRTILVPSTMVLIDKWNWYLPQWLDNILPGESKFNQNR